MKNRMSMVARGESGKILVMALVALVLGALLLTSTPSTISLLLTGD